MSRLSWDATGNRLFDVGLDRGVLYLADRSGVPWNGLRSVEEDPGGESTEPLYFDGVKYLDSQKFGDFSATLTAIVFPDEFLEYEGFVEDNGLFIDDQPPKVFHLSYRTLVGNDILGAAFGYQIHLVYNVTAVANTKAHNTLGEETDPTEFSWQLSAVPETIDGYRPTAHFILDSTLLPPAALGLIEDILYGDEDSDAHFPTISELIVAVVGSLVTIIDNGDGTWTAIGPDSAVHMLTSDEFEIDSIVAEYIDADTYTLTSL